MRWERFAIFIFTANKKQIITTVIAAFLCITAISVLFNEKSFEVTEVNNLIEGINLPIIMYHNIVENPAKSGQYIITPEALEKDMIYIKEHGYQTITVQDLIAYVYDGEPLPEKSIMLTFDDGYYSHFVFLQPLLEKYDMKAVLSVVGIFTDTMEQYDDLNPDYSYLRWKDIKELSGLGYIEIQNHSYNLHHNNSDRLGSRRNKGESKKDYKSVFMEDTQKMQTELSEICNITPNTYTYPYGVISKETTAYLKEMGFQVSFSCYEKTNTITRNPDCLYLLNRYNRPGNMSTEAFMKKADI